MLYHILYYILCHTISYHIIFYHIIINRIKPTEADCTHYIIILYHDILYDII